ncbi:MAG: peptide chain release factor 1 [Candidatus Nealsonbacteria bacterium]|nr:peptide chain release factor 1 [Candidatus Nealsonbacteria bacterium]
MLNLDNIKKEYDEILNQLSSPELISDWEKFEALSKKKGHLEKIIEKQKEIDQIKKEMEENRSILSSGEDSELAALAEGELKTLVIKQENLEKELEKITKEKEETIPRAVIVEIRAGTGGEEAALFAADLFKMYSKYAQLQGWKQKVLESNPTGIGGFKEIIFELKNGDVFSKMKWEGGVHRVQRIPTTEKSGRVHTSTASVAILPKPAKTEFIIKPSDLKIDVYKSSGPGGQYVNKRETAARITHLPTGLVVTSQTERNLLQNKENALAILEARLLEKKEADEAEKMGDKRRIQIGQAKRAEKIRTYNFPQDRLTDHRIKKSFHQLEKILNGELASVIETLESTDLKI